MLIELLALKELNKPVIIPQPKPTQTIKVELKKKTKQSKTYEVKQNDTLISIAKKNKTTWKRIYYKNKSIKNPNNIKVGQRIVIPSKTEKLKKRNYILVEAKRAKETVKNGSPRQSRYLLASSGWYPYGQCTWWVSTKRAVGQWGNASDWLYNAQRDGLATGSVPKAGAIGWTSGHVTFVEKVAGDKVLISEANYDYRGSIRTIWVDASEYSYIY